MTKLTPHLAVMRTGRKNAASAFSLVEVVLALGVMGVALVPMVGLFGIGLGSLRQSMHFSTQAMIMQSLEAEIRMADFSTLTDSTSSNYFPNTFPRYYDDEGRATTAANNIYTVTLAGSGTNAQMPGCQVPSTQARQIQFNFTGKDRGSSVLGIWAINNGR